MKYMRFIFRVVIALIAIALAFIIGVYLPLSVYSLFQGDPGMPGGAGLVIIGLPLGIK